MPRPMRAGLRHPEHHVAHRAAGQVQRHVRAGHVGGDGGGLAAEQLQRKVRCSGAGAMPSAASRPNETIAWREVLSLRHALGDPLQPAHRIVLADRQVEEHQAEVVAQLLARVPAAAGSPARWRGWCRPSMQFAAVEHVAAQGAGGRGHQHVVDGAVEGAADRLDLVQRQRLGPGHALADAQAVRAARSADRRTATARRPVRGRSRRPPSPPPSPGPGRDRSPGPSRASGRRSSCSGRSRRPAARPGCRRPCQPGLGQLAAGLVASRAVSVIDSITCTSAMPSA